MTQTYEDLYNFVCETELGYGLSRHVYENRLMPGVVIKVEDDFVQHDGHKVFQNINEWETWKYAADIGFASRWFAACRYISANGRILIMEKTRRPLDSEYPAKLPAFFVDLKKSNFGICKSAEGRETFVCHDYGVNANVIKNGLRSRRMITMKWKDDDE